MNHATLLAYPTVAIVALAGCVPALFAVHWLFAAALARTTGRIEQALGRVEKQLLDLRDQPGRPTARLPEIADRLAAAIEQHAVALDEHGAAMVAAAVELAAATAAPQAGSFALAASLEQTALKRHQ
jgi:hypothetical protein